MGRSRYIFRVASLGTESLTTSDYTTLQCTTTAAIVSAAAKLTARAAKKEGVREGGRKSVALMISKKERVKGTL